MKDHDPAFFEDLDKRIEASLELPAGYYRRRPCLMTDPGGRDARRQEIAQELDALCLGSRDSL